MLNLITKLAKKSLRLIFNKLYGDKSAIYLRAVNDRYRSLSKDLRAKVNYLNTYDEQILELHVGSSAKEQNLLKVKIRLTLTWSFFVETVPQFTESSSIVDIGAASGLFLKMLGKSGTAVEDWEPALKFLSKQGIETHRPNGSKLPFPDSKFDYCTALETLEHLPDPLGMLKEMKRISKKGILISIPYREQTTIVPKKDQNIAGQHIFEFSVTDFHKLASHCGLIVVAERSIHLQDSGSGIESILRRRSKYHEPSVSLYYLEPV